MVSRDLLHNDTSLLQAAFFVSYHGSSKVHQTPASAQVFELALRTHMLPSLQSSKLLPSLAFDGLLPSTTYAQLICSLDRSFECLESKLRLCRHLIGWLSLAAEFGVFVLLLVRGSACGGLLLRCMREVGRLIGRRGSRSSFARSIGFERSGSTAATDVVLGFSSIIPSVLLRGLTIAANMVCREVLHLRCLRVDHVGSVLKVCVNKLFVGLVDQRSEVDG